MTYDQMIERYRATYYKVIDKHGLDPSLAYPYAVLDALLFYYTGDGAPGIVSGRRTASEQRSLYARWKNGEPGISKPASCSWHLVGRAFDLNKNHPNYFYFSYWLRSWYSGWIRDGSTFGDPGHWDLPGTETPPCVL